MRQRAKNISALAIGFFSLAVFCRTPEPARAQRDAVGPAAQDSSVDAVERQGVISGAAANLRQHYFDRDTGQLMADALLAHEKRGDDDAAKDGGAFADLLTRQMRDASHDMHLILEYSQRPLPEGPPPQTADGLARFRNAMLQQTCMIRKAEILPHDIGYLKLDFFTDTSVCGSELRSAMASLNQAYAIIFDLRDNAGGFPDSVSLIASYLFDHPECMYGPRGAPRWTPGRGLRSLGANWRISRCTCSHRAPRGRVQSSSATT